MKPTKPFVNFDDVELLWGWVCSAHNCRILCALVLMLLLRCFFQTKHHQWLIVPVCTYCFAACLVFFRAMFAYRKSFKRWLVVKLGSFAMKSSPFFVTQKWSPSWCPKKYFNKTKQWRERPAYFSSRRSNVSSFYVFAAVIAAGIEADRLLAVEGAKQAKQLKEGFVGIKEAKSSCPGDQDSWNKNRFTLICVLMFFLHTNLRNHLMWTLMWKITWEIAPSERSASFQKSPHAG